MKKTLILFLLISLNQVSFSQSKESKYAVIDSLLHFDNEVYPNFKAKMLLENEFSKFDNEAEYWNRLAVANFQANIGSSARRCLQKGLEINPNYYDLYLTKSMFYYNDYKVIDAVNLIDSILKFKKKGKYYFQKGMYNFYLAKKQEALFDYENALKYNFKNEKVYLNLSMINYALSNYEDAHKYITKAIKYKPNFGRYYYLRGTIKTLIFDLKGSCEDLSKAISLGYRNENVNFIQDNICKETKENKFYILAQMSFNEDKNQSIIFMNHLIEDLKLDSSKYYRFRGYIYQNLNNYRKSESDYFKALELNQDSLVQITRSLVNIYLFSKKYSKALKYNKKLLQINPNDYLALVDDGRINAELGNDKKAIQSFSKSLEINKDSYFALGGLANIYLKQKRGKEAQEYAEKATLINPNYAFGYYVLGKTKVILRNGNYCNDFIRAKELGQKDMVEILNEYCNTK